MRNTDDDTNDASGIADGVTIGGGPIINILVFLPKLELNN